MWGSNMKKLAMVAVLLCVTVAFAQSRTEEYRAVDVTVQEIVLTPLVDGGCVVRWSGSVTSTDGGSTVAVSTTSADLRTPAMQARCLALAQAGEGRLAVALRLQPDGGAP